MHREFLKHILSGHSGQLIIIFITKTSILLSRVLGKKWYFCSMGLPGAPLCACYFSAGISVVWIEAP